MTAPGTRTQSNAAASSIAVIGAVVTTFATFLVALLVSRDAAGFAGAFFVATAVTTIGGNALSLGTPTGLVYFMPQALSGDTPAPRSLILQSLRPVAAASVAAAVVVALVAPVFADLVSEQRTEEITILLRCFAPAIPAWALTAGLLGATRGLGTMTPTVLVGQVLRPGGQVVLLGSVYLAGEPSTVAVGLAWMVPVVGAFVAAVISVIRLGGGDGRGQASPVTTGEFWAYTKARAGANALQIALERIDVIFVSAMLGSEASGVYGALTRYIAAGNFLIFAVAQAVSVTMRRAIAAGDLDQAGSILRQATSWLVLFAWPYFLVVALKPEPLARLLSEAYVADARILTILALGMMVSAAAGPIDLTLLMLGRSGLSLLGVVVAVVTDIVLILVLSPLFGLAGAAWAWAIAVVAQNLLASHLVRRESGLTVPSPAWVGAAIVAIVATVPISLLTGTRFLDLVVTGIVGGIAVAAGVYVLRDRFGIDRLIKARRAA